MSKTLEERLRAAKAELLKANSEMARLATKLPSEVSEHFQAVLALEGDVEHWIGMMQARAAARSMLTGLEAQADGNDQVPFGVSRIHFQHARLIGVQAYLATNWAMSDRLTGLVGRVLCIKTSLNNPKSAPQLVSHFVGEETKNRTAAMLFSSVRRTFGWPISVSYALRNHFIHDGGVVSSLTFFEGPDSKAAFRISEEGWAHIEHTAQTYGVEPSHHRAGASWPTTPRDDLRVVLDACERETDDALGVLVGSACRSIVALIGCMLGAD